MTVRLSRRSFLALVPSLALVRSSRRVAVTMDDVNWAAIPEPFAESALARILEATGSRKAALLVIGRNVENITGRRILEAWSGAGHVIGNHTYDHRPLYQAGPEAFIDSIERNEPLLASYSTFRKWFRFPQLKEGDSREARDAVRAFLDRTGYRNAQVTIDTSDWYYDQRLRQRLESNPNYPVANFREPYIRHVLDRARYYDGLSVDVLGRSVRHTLLVHYNLLNALFLKDVLEALASQGFDTIDADEAYEDPVHRTRADTLPAGESLLWSIAHASGKYEARLRYPGEDGDYEKPLLDDLGL
jgi:peptidoglycan/xylan/chitin deacetylase (PgdA/CDA1 family)